MVDPCADQELCFFNYCFHADRYYDRISRGGDKESHFNKHASRWETEVESPAPMNWRQRREAHESICIDRQHNCGPFPPKHQRRKSLSRGQPINPEKNRAARRP
jgi:hypothetical protein